MDNIRKGRGYTREEIELMIQNTLDIATKFTIYAMSSSGIRCGAWDGLTWDDVNPVYEILPTTQGNEIQYQTQTRNEKNKIVCGVMEIYKETPDHYTALISIEAYNELMKYKETWIEKIGREPTYDDPLLIGRDNQPLRALGIKDRIYYIVNSRKIRGVLKEDTRYYDVPIMHGFRRFFNRTFSDVQKGTIGELVVRERLMGHKGLTKTEANYYWDNLNDKVKAYLKVMPELIISDELRQIQKLEAEEQKNKELESKIEEKDKALRKVDELEAKVKRMEKYQTN